MTAGLPRNELRAVVVPSVAQLQEASARLWKLLEKSWDADFKNTVRMTPRRAADITWLLHGLEDRLTDSKETP